MEEEQRVVKVKLQYNVGPKTKMGYRLLPRRISKRVCPPGYIWKVSWLCSCRKDCTKSRLFGSREISNIKNYAKVRRSSFVAPVTQVAYTSPLSYSVAAPIAPVTTSYVAPAYSTVYRYWNIQYVPI